MHWDGSDLIAARGRKEHAATRMNLLNFGNFYERLHHGMSDALPNLAQSEPVGVLWQ